MAETAKMSDFQGIYQFEHSIFVFFLQQKYNYMLKYSFFQERDPLLGLYRPLSSPKNSPKWEKMLERVIIREYIQQTSNIRNVIVSLNTVFEI